VWTKESFTERPGDDVESIVNNITVSNSTTETEEEWDLTLQPGWNKIQRNFSRNSTSGGYKVTERYVNAPDDTSGFKWTINTISP
jgi:hypothetical protein